MANPIRIRGVDYPSQAAAARALGVTPETVGKALMNGTEDNVGTRPVSKRPAVVLNGVRYKTQREAGYALGVTDGTICRRLKAQREQRA